MRTAEMTRNTFETNISLTINLDGNGEIIMMIAKLA